MDAFQNVTSDFKSKKTGTFPEGTRNDFLQSAFWTQFLSVSFIQLFATNFNQTIEKLFFCLIQSLILLLGLQNKN